MMRRAVTYTHQAGGGGANICVPSRKISRYFWAPPRIVEVSKEYMVLCFWVSVWLAEDRDGIWKCAIKEYVSKFCEQKSVTFHTASLKMF